jgi:hypothetical protein
MAQQIPKFDIQVNGILSASGTDNWVDLTALLYAGGFIPSAVIPSGEQIWVGYITCISPDKNSQFELRPNKTTKSAGNTTDTDLRGYTAVEAGRSEYIDAFLGGAVYTFVPVGVASTGVEKLWLRIKCGSASAATYEYLLNCARY